MIKTLLKSGTCPEWYNDAHLELAKKGMRVIALARRKVRLPAAWASAPLAWRHHRPHTSAVAFLYFVSTAGQGAAGTGAARQASVVG